MTASAKLPPALIVSRFDLERLERLLDRVGGGENLDLLRAELDRADVVEPKDVPPDVVTMNSQVRVVDEATGEESELRLVFPAAADAERGAISVLAPIGSALLGLRVGATIEWPVPDGRARRIRVIAVSYQPEAAGDHHL
ncbi:MAG: nucleoside diphosphate kinase regulator [Deltaproteobacteria bacterium]|nr:nucleoside diphosphate kinase regulator [Deltaproteobacteria bacterium]